MLLVVDILAILLEYCAYHNHHRLLHQKGSKIIQIKYLKHKITQQYTSKDDKKHH